MATSYCRYRVPRWIRYLCTFATLFLTITNILKGGYLISNWESMEMKTIRDIPVDAPKKPAYSDTVTAVFNTALEPVAQISNSIIIEPTAAKVTLNPNTTSTSDSTEVFLWFGYESAVCKHLYLDGIRRSSHLTRIHNTSRFLPNGQTMWVGIDQVPRKDCQNFTGLVKNALDERHEQGISNDVPFHIYYISFKDQDFHFKCQALERLLKNRHLKEQTRNVVLHYAQRSIVEGRDWSVKKNWVDTGKIVPAFAKSIDAINQGSGKILWHHLNYPVRTDIVKTVSERLSIVCLGVSLLSDPIESSCDRSIDVSHFWSLDMDGEKTRITVSRMLNDEFCAQNLVEDLYHDDNSTTTSLGTNKSTATKVSKNLKAGPECFIGLAGTRGTEGRNGVTTDYIDTMLRSKLVVVSQRSRYEDHWRLMEALVSGALVLTDTMLSLPPGFKDGVSLLEYGSKEELLAKVAYYTDPQHAPERLLIAQEGRRLAMERFRSWHLMEKLILGKIATSSGFHV